MGIVTDVCKWAFPADPTNCHMTIFNYYMIKQILSQEIWNIIGAIIL